MNEVKQRVKYLDFLGMEQTGTILTYLASNEPDNPYVVIVDDRPELNIHKYGDVPYAEMRRSEDVELISR